MVMAKGDALAGYSMEELQAIVTQFGDEFLGLTRVSPGAYLWDTNLISGGAQLPSRLRFFVTERGRIGSGFAREKTQVDTNLRQANTLQIEIGAEVQEIYLSAMPVGLFRNSPDVQSYLNRVLEEYAFDFYVNRTEQIGTRPAIMFGSVGDVTGEIAQGSPIPQATGSQGSNGMAQTLLTSIPIPPRTKFEATMSRNDNAVDIIDVPVGFDFKLLLMLRGQFNALVTQ